MNTKLWVVVGVMGLTLAAWGQQPVPPAATPAEVAAGQDRYKYVTSYAIAASGISSSGITPTDVRLIMATNGVGAGANVFNVQLYGALGDGVNEDTLACNNAIAAAKAAGGGIVYFPAGVYKLRKNATGTYNGCLQLNNAVNVIFLGDGASQTRLLNADDVNDNVSVVYVQNANYISVIGMTLDGGGVERGYASLENEGLCFAFVTNALVRDVIITNVLADGFDGDWNVNLRMENVQAHTCGNMGIKPNGYDIHLSQIRAVNCGYTGTDFDKGGLGLMDCYESTVSQLHATNNLFNLMISGNNRVVVDNFYLRTDSNSRTNIIIFGGVDISLKAGNVLGGVGIYTTNVLGGSLGPAFVTVENVSFYTVQGVYAATGIQDFTFANVKHLAPSNPYGTGSGQGFYFGGIVERGHFVNCNMRSGSSNIRFASTFHNVMIANNIFGGHVGSAIYGTGGSAIATNLSVVNNSFQQSGATSISMGENAGMWGNTFAGNVCKGTVILTGGTNDILNNRFLAGITLTGANCRSNWISGNRASATVTFTTTTAADQIWGINAGVAEFVDNNP